MSATEPGAGLFAEFSWVVWLEWVLVTALGWLLAWAATGTAWWVGAAIGVLQWLVIRRTIDRQGMWVVASTAGWAMGWTIAQALLGAEGGVWLWPIAGAMMGAMQWVVLQRRLRGAYWWLIISVLAWAAASFSSVEFYFAGAVAGAVSGVAMELFVRQRGG